MNDEDMMDHPVGLQDHTIIDLQYLMRIISPGFIIQTDVLNMEFNTIDPEIFKHLITKAVVVEIQHAYILLNSKS